MSTEEKIILRPPLSDSDVEGLRAGDRVLFNGVIYTARDAAHARLVALLDEVRLRVAPELLRINRLPKPRGDL